MFISVNFDNMTELLVRRGVCLLPLLVFVVGVWCLRYTFQPPSMQPMHRDRSLVFIIRQYGPIAVGLWLYAGGS